MQFGPNSKVITNNYTEPKQNRKKPPQDLQDKSDSSNNKTRKKHKKHTQNQPKTAKSTRGPKDDTDSEDEDNRRGEFHGPQTQVIDNVDVMQFGPNNKVITNNYTEPKQNRKKPPQDLPDISDTEGGSKDGGEDFRIADGGELFGTDVDMLRAKKSVGIIRGPGNLQGTGFLLKDNLVMTAYHVIKDIVSEDGNRKCLNRQHTENKKISIQFDYQQAADAGNVQNYFYFTPDIQYYNHELDVAVLKLFPDSTKDLPQSLEHFSPVQDGMKAHMIGHPKGRPLEIDPNIERYKLTDEDYRKAVDWSTANYNKNGYDGILDSRKILFHCRFANGASGCPGCYTDPAKENAEVVWMLLAGYPGFYYKNLTPAEQMTVSDKLCIEQGITMEEIWKDMLKKNRDLSLKIFGPRNACFMPIGGSNES